MRGRLAFILLASVALVTAPRAGTAAVPRAGTRAGTADQAPVTLPTSCTHDGGSFRTHGSRRKKRIAIGFDDGPSNYTLRVLTILRRFEAHATFFEIGQETTGRGATMKKVLDQGNEIGNHSLHHEVDPSTESLHKTNRLIKAATGFRPCDFRPPDGRVNSGLIDRVRALGMVAVD